MKSVLSRPGLVNWLLALFLAASLASCKSNGATDVLDPALIAPKQAAQGAELSSTASLGSGPAKLAVLLPFSSTGQDAQRAQAIRDSVALAMDDLGSNSLTVSFVDVEANATDAREIARKAMNNGAAAVLGPFQAVPAAEVAAIRAGRPAPVFLLTNAVRGSGGIYNLPLTTKESLVAAVDGLARKGARNFLLVLPQGKDAQALERAVDFAAANHGGRLAAKARYDVGTASAVAAVNTVFAVMDAPDAVVVAGDDASAAIVDAVRAKKRAVPIVVGANWLKANIANPSFDGLLTADLDHKEMGAVSGRYRARFGREMEPVGAYAYDVVALLTGIQRAVGSEGFVRPIIESGNGYRGATGLFRFRGDGSVDRLLPVYRLKNGKLVESIPAAKSF